MMTNIPKKLEVPFFEIEKKYPDWMRQIRLSIQQLICNQNELIDYLQAKEEASKCICPENSWRSDCPYPHTKNPPEHEEEWEQGFDKKFTVRTVGVNSNAIKQYFEAIKDYIRDNFVSKEKIKNHCKSTLKNYEIRSNFSDGVTYAINNLISSLGLGD